MHFIPLPPTSPKKPVVGIFLHEGTAVFVYAHETDQVILTSSHHGCTLQVGGTVHDTLRYISHNHNVTLINPFCFMEQAGVEAPDEFECMHRSWNDYVEHNLRLEGTIASESCFYSYEIPRPDLYVRRIATPIADLTYGSNCLHAYWIKNTKQVLLCSNGQWVIQPNGPIQQSLTAFFGSTPCVASLQVFEPESSEPCSTDQIDQVYECEWSDYACDNLFIRSTLV